MESCYFVLRWFVAITRHNSADSVPTSNLVRIKALSPARWHDKHASLSSLGMLGTTQLNSFFFSDHIIFNNGHMKHAHSWQRMTNNNINNKKKQVSYLRQSLNSNLNKR